ncbi:hypothetical protein [Nitrospina gracilis]|uniref:hypothetical protein n=1 Tax=Nitrospina gracilis TaxID=35801 RepID=UPI001F3A7056|nr:hypothetical protein [Nitrospina gracilis]MCF8719982.1 hypothetical protein [Nitrospina gracilis Nb-211]
MMKKMILTASILLLIGLLVQPVWAHVTPNVRLLTTRETVSQLLPKGNLFVKKVKLTEDQQKKLNSYDNWRTQVDEFKFYISRDKQDKLIRSMVSMTQITRHGPLVVAVALNPDGTVADALVTDSMMEPMTWVSPILKSDFMKSFRGRGSDMSLKLADKWKEQFSGISQDFARVIANAVKEAAQLYEVVFKSGS